jgi:DNA-binding MarR family transcriptional regulator
MAKTDKPDSVAFMRGRIRTQVNELVGEDVSSMGMELASLVKLVSNLYEGLRRAHPGPHGISAQRWGVLMFILVEEQKGMKEGVTPTMITRCQQVSKNTVSALLRGLEEQGLVERSLDAKDRRLFRFKLTTAGRELIHATTLKRLTYLNDLASGLTPDQQAQLAVLLGVLFHSINRRVHHSPSREADADADLVHFTTEEEAAKPEMFPGG